MRNPVSHIRKWLAERGHKRSDKWPEVRKEHLERHPTCEACGSKKDVQVHHVKPFHLFPELELDPKNLFTLCETIRKEHHLKVGHTVAGKSNWKLFNPSVREDAAKMLASKQ